VSRIRLFAPEGAQGDWFELRNGEAAIVGRAPDIRSSRMSELVSNCSTVHRLPVASPSVSANHVLLESRVKGVVVTDLASRNGTWVRLPAGHGVEVHDSSEIQLRIGEVPTSSASDGEAFPNVKWRDVKDFAGSVAKMARTWLAQTLGSGEVDVIIDRDPVALAAPGTIRIPLPGAQALQVRINETVDAEWQHRINQLWRHIDSQVKLLEAEEVSRADGMILASDSLRAAHRHVIEAATRGARLLLLGPSGSGKELLARAYHRHSGRSGPFVALNCAELDDRIRAELFGTELGAFTDAVRRAGAVEIANGGTLFLDEVGELSKDVQATLLRFLDCGQYARLGDLAHVRRSDVRVVCATNRDLRDEVRRDRFRLDLWFRIAGHIVEIPPLHLRPEDLRAFLMARPHRGTASTWGALSSEAIDVVHAHRWDSRWGGNFRELENFASRLPDATGPGSIDGAQCLAAIQAGMVEAPSRNEPRHEVSVSNWPAAAEAAARAAALVYVEDHATPPSDWNAVKDYIENYLKPVVFAQLSGAHSLPSLDIARQEASRLNADRATQLKQLERYFERFARLERDKQNRLT
jgi:transcriptional regulator with GAF, ATPase, and Fis domain